MYRLKLVDLRPGMGQLEIPPGRDLLHTKWPDFDGHGFTQPVIFTELRKRWETMTQIPPFAELANRRISILDGDLRYRDRLTSTPIYLAESSQQGTVVEVLGAEPVHVPGCGTTFAAECDTMRQALLSSALERELPSRIRRILTEDRKRMDETAGVHWYRPIVDIPALPKDVWSSLERLDTGIHEWMLRQGKDGCLWYEEHGENKEYKCDHMISTPVGCYIHPYSIYLWVDKVEEQAAKLGIGEERMADLLAGILMQMTAYSLLASRNVAGTQSGPFFRHFFAAPLATGLAAVCGSETYRRYAKAQPFPYSCGLNYIGRERQLVEDFNTLLGLDEDENRFQDDLPEECRPLVNERKADTKEEREAAYYMRLGLYVRLLEGITRYNEPGGPFNILRDRSLPGGENAQNN